MTVTVTDFFCVLCVCPDERDHPNVARRSPHPTGGIITLLMIAAALLWLAWATPRA